MLTLDAVEVVYGGAVLVLHGLSLSVPEGRVTALLGPNGAGKSTTLKSVSGILRSEGGRVTAGRIRFGGDDVTGLPPEEMVRRGIFHVMEGRRVFSDLTVEENLACGAYLRRDRRAVRGDLDGVYDVFPRLRERRRQPAGYLSGGEQQMLAIGRGLMASPRLMLLDEPSLGIAPLLVQEIFRMIARINRERGTTILLVEQNANAALSIAHEACLVEGGRVLLSGEAEALKDNPEVKEFYLGFAEHGGRKDYRAMKEEARGRTGPREGTHGTPV